MSESKYVGLSQKDVEESRNQWGENVLTPPHKEPWWLLLLHKFNDPIIRILVIAAFIAIGVGIFNDHYIEGLGIVVAILLATLMAFINEYKAGKEFDHLNSVNDDLPVKVIRQGNVTTVPKREVVVGDIVIVDQGDEIPSDGQLLESVSLSVNESALTGEPITRKGISIDSNSSETTYPRNCVYKGTIVVEGHAIYETTRVGDSTEIGKTAREATMQINQPTPLGIQLERLSAFISTIAFSLAKLVFLGLVVVDFVHGDLPLSLHQGLLLLFILLSINIILIKYWTPSVNYLLKAIRIKYRVPEICPENPLKGWIITTSIGVAFFLVSTVTTYMLGINLFTADSWFSLDVLSKLLLYFMVAMTLIVVAVPEGLAMSVTLSLAYSMRRMTATNNLVRKMQATETMGAATVICTDKTGTLTRNQMTVVESYFYNYAELNEDDPLLTIIKYSLAVNSTAHLDFSSKPLKTIGNPTDAALLLWLNESGFDYKGLRSDFEVYQQQAFSSERKYMFTYGHSNTLNKNLLLVKGAPEMVTAMCNLQNHTRDYNEIVNGYQERSLRVIAFAYKELNDSIKVIPDSRLNDLQLLGFVGIIDPVRADVPEAIHDCHTAGIEVKMVTGDNVLTATEIGRQINLFDEVTESSVISGSDFEKLPDNEARLVAKNLRIMYRARPTDKQKLVRLLQENGSIVAVTGDGTNDAPALNRANAGLAMGSGTSVAKEASDIILLDDSFTSIVNAVRWGRTLYQNIQKFLYFQLTINLLAISVVLLGPFIGVTLPLTVTQMLWVNLIMDTFAALALATEPPSRGIMQRKPRRNDDFIITPAIRKGILFTAFLFFIVLVGLLWGLKRDGNITDYELTLFFNVFVLLQFWNLFNARSFGQKSSAFKGLKRNKSFVIIALAILIGQVLIVQFGGGFFRTVPLSFSDWLIIFTATSSILWIYEIVKFAKRYKTHTR